MRIYTARLMKRNVLILAFCLAMMMSANSLLIATSPLVGVALAGDPAWATVPIALMFVGTLSSTYPASMLMKHIGRRAGFTIGLLIGVLGAVFSALGILTQTFGGFCFGAVLIGIFNAFGQYYRFAAADVASLDYRSRAISYVMAGGIAAAVIGPNLARVTLDLVSSATFAGSYLALLGLYALSLIVLQWARIPAPTAVERHATGRPLSTVARNPMFLVAVLSATIAYGVMNLVMTATPLAMHHHGHLFEDTALVIQWHVLGMFAPSFVTGHLIRKFGVSNIMLTGCLSLALCALVNLSGESVAHFFAGLVLLGVGWNFLFVGATDLLTQTYAAEEKAKTQGLNDLIVFSTVAMTALSSGYLHLHFGWAAINYSVLPLVLVAFVATVWLKQLKSEALAG
jgi:MFS family permease